MAHFQYPMRRATEPERAAFAYPREQGIMKPHIDKIGIDIGARLVAKTPFLLGDFMIMERDEYVIVDKHKDAGKFLIRCMRDNRIAIEATTEEIDSRFYVVPGPERPLKYAPAYPLLGRDEGLKPCKMAPDAEGEGDDE